MSVTPITPRPLVIVRRAAIAAADNLSIALVYEGMTDPRASTSLDDAEACLNEALHLIAKARGPQPPVPPAVAARADDHFKLACAVTGAAPFEEVA